jgi:hypothetical protein
MFQKVSRSVVFRIFKPRTSVYPDTHSGGIVIGIGFGSDGESIGKTSDFSLGNGVQGLGVGVRDGGSSQIGFGRGAEQPLGVLKKKKKMS